MASPRRSGGPRRRYQLSVEGLEARELLASYTGIIAQAELAAQQAAVRAAQSSLQSSLGSLMEAGSPTHDQILAAASSSSSGGSGSSGASRQPSAMQQAISFAQILYPPGTPQPSLHEIRRQAIVAKFTANYQTGPGRFSNQATTIHLLGYGGANFSYHTNVNAVIYTPTDPTQPVVGSFTMIPRNVLASGVFNTVVLTGNPQSNPHALPTFFTFGPDQGESGGFPLSSTGSPGSPQPQNMIGTVQIHYVPNHSGGSSSSGTAYIVVKGLQYNSGLLNPIGVKGNLPGPGALHPNAISANAY